MTDLAGIQSAMAGTALHTLAGVLAELGSSGPNQHARMLRLHTPLGRDVLLAERACIRESITPGNTHAGFEIELFALSTQAHLQASDLLGQCVRLDLLTALSTTALRPFHGHVTQFELLGSDGGLARYRLIVEPWLAFLGQRVNAHVFQDLSVLDITEAILQHHQAHLPVLWRIDVADPAVFAKRSLCTQFNETDLAFLQRLWLEEGLFAWFEHNDSNHDGTSLGTHTLVLADHNGAFQPNVQTHIRFTQAGTTLKEDSITQWQGHRQMQATELMTASWDYRAVTCHAASAQSDVGHAKNIVLRHQNHPGHYAYETPAQAARRAHIQLEALQSQRKRFEGIATVRTLQPGTTFTLLEHAEHTGLFHAPEDAVFAVLSTTHSVRNNLSADAQAGLPSNLGSMDHDSDEPLFACHFSAQRQAIPFRAHAQDEQGRLAHPKPTVHGAQTALVVGLQEPIHTDRDGRIKVQFHWQRGTQSSHRLNAPNADNAPASHASGTWVRVVQPWGGQNWGHVFMPRLGQEVLIEFLEGDIDRPVVIGALYNGQGQEDAQSNLISAGAAQSTGNAPAWFAGHAQQGQWQGHAHAASLSGFKSQSLDQSQTGHGGHNQLVFDDTPNQSRTLLHTTQSQTWLQMGHLLQQADNQRLTPRGQGWELHTQAQGALRSAKGLHLSTHAHPQGTSGSQGQPMHSGEAQRQLQQHTNMLQSLHDNAKTHRAQLQDESAPTELPALKGLHATLDSLAGLSDLGDGVKVPATERPDLLLSAASDIAAFTPAHTVLSAGQHTTLTTQQDLNLLAQRHQAWAVKNGISLFTRGEAKDKQRAVQDTGIKLHAASGSVNVQAQSDTFTLTALKRIDMQSTAADIVITAPNRIVLNGGGGYVKIEGSNIEIGTRGKASFKAAMKELTGGASASTSHSLKKPANMPTKPMPVMFSLMDAEGKSPPAETVTFKGATAQSLSMTGGIAVIDHLKPGLIKGTQNSRRS